MPLPATYHNDIQVWDCWDNPMLDPKYKSEKQYRASIVFDTPVHLNGTQAFGDSPDEARANLIEHFDHKIPAGTNTIKSISGAKEL